jgi:hypothetical protein
MADGSKLLEPRYRGLRPIKPGEVLNPTGRNGSSAITELRRFMDERAEPSSRRTRSENLWLALYTTAIDRRRRDHVAAARVLLAYHLGKPLETLEVSGPDGGPITSVALTTAELREELARLLARADGEEVPDGSSVVVEPEAPDSQ